MRGVPWRRPEGALDDRGDLIVINCPRSAGTSLVQQPVDAVLQKASTPLPDRVLMEAEFARNGFTRDAIRASQDNETAFGRRPRRAMATNLSFENSRSSELRISGAIGRPVALAITSLPLSCERAILQ